MIHWLSNIEQPGLMPVSKIPGGRRGRAEAAGLERNGLLPLLSSSVQSVHLYLLRIKTLMNDETAEARTGSNFCDFPTNRDLWKVRFNSWYSASDVDAKL